MEIRGRTFLAAITASALILLFTAQSHSSSSAEAERKYSVAQERLADLKKSPKKKKYRSYWMDSARTFETIEKKYPSSTQAADACFDRAGIYSDLYQFNRYSKDLDEASKVYAKCQAAYPRHTRAPEALYRVVAINRDGKKDTTTAMATLRTMAEAYPDSEWTAKARAKLGIRAAKNGKGRPKGTELRKQPEPVIARPTAPKDLGVVKSVRFWSGGAYTRIVIDQDRQLKFQMNELKNPARLVFDIKDARVDDSVNKDPLAVNDGILRQVRTSQFAPDTVRVVLDLASLKSVAAFPLKDPERLVIDVTGDAAPEGDAAAGDPSEGTEKPVEPLRGPEAAAQQKEQTQARTEPRDDKKLSLSRQLGLKVKTVAIDAGHGGKDPGAIGKGGLKEKHVTLDIARRLRTLVRQRLDCDVIMTRDSDVFIELDQRPYIAKSKDADLFVSVHVNASRKRKTRGIETYIQSFRASDRDAMATAALENASTAKTLGQLDTELEKILKGLSNQNKEYESVELANYVQNSLVKNVRPVRGHVANLGVKSAFFYVLVNTNMPSILAEVGFISNPEEEKLLAQEPYRQKIAEALFQGVKNFVESRGQQTAGL